MQRFNGAKTNTALNYNKPMRQPKPFFRRQNQAWYVQLGKQQVRLSRDKEEAFEKYYHLMANKQKLTSSVLTVAVLCESYLEWLKENRAETTYDKAQHYLSLFVQYIGTRLRVSSLESSLVTDWLGQYSDWTSTTKHDAASIVQRAVNWGCKEEAL